MPEVQIRRGELYWASWDPARGSARAGTRPTLIIQSDPGNSNPRYPNTIVAALTTSGRADAPFHVPIGPSTENGLSQLSYVMCEQIMTISKDRLQGRLGHVSPDKMAAVGEAIARVLAIQHR